MLQRTPSKAFDPEKDLEKGDAGVSSRQTGASSSSGDTAADGAASPNAGLYLQRVHVAAFMAQRSQERGQQGALPRPRARGGARDAEFFAVRTLASGLQ